MKQSPVSAESQQKIVSQLHSLSYLLDESIKIPGTKYRIGIDPLLGLLPGAGDYLGAIFSGYILFQSARLGTSKITLARMTINILTEILIGIFPILGDIFDATWKANKKNMQLLSTYLQEPKKTQKANLWFVVLLLAVLLVILLMITSITFLLIKFIGTILFAG